MGSAVSAATSVIGGGVGSALGGLTNGIAAGVTPPAEIANQAAANQQINALQGQTSNAQGEQQYLQQSALDQGAYAQAQQVASNAALGQANALNTGGNVQNSLGLLETQANGSAPSAAEGVLQQGSDQALATQASLANSGNISQQISGQKTAMDNAANLVQTAANQASQLRANQQQVGQQNYAAAAQQQANQAAQNVNASTNIANTGVNLLNTQQQAGLGYGQLANNTANNAGNIALGNSGQAQDALNQNQAQQNQVTGGLLGGLGSAAVGIAGPALLASDKDSKENILPDTPESLDVAKTIKQAFLDSDKNGKEDIKSTPSDHKDSLVHKFLDALDSVTYEYKKPDGKMGKTPGTHMGVIAQDVEKAPGGKSMVLDTPKGKAIDLASAVGTLLSAAADAHDRISTIEELFKARKGAKK